MEVHRRTGLQGKAARAGFSLLFLGLIELYRLPIYGFATGKPATFTELFSTTAFSGSMELIQKLNWVGYILNGIITISCFLGAVFVVIVTVFSILYLAGSPLFDAVHELKGQGQGSGALGFKGMVNSVKSGNMGSGLDAIFGFILMFLPDIRRVSDYRDDNTKYNLNAEEDTIGKYLLKVGFQRMLVIFFCAIGFSGTLWQGFAKGADAMAYVADQMVSVNLTSYIDRLVAQQKYHSFECDATGDNYGALMQDVAENVYVQMLKKVTGMSDDEKAQIGYQVENWVREQFYGTDTIGAKANLTAKQGVSGANALLSKMCNAGEEPSALLAEGDDYVEQAVKRVTLSVSVSSAPVGASMTIDANTLCNTIPQGKHYVNVQFGHKSVSNLKDYWVIEGSSSSGSGNTNANGCPNGHHTKREAISIVSNPAANDSTDVNMLTSLLRGVAGHENCVVVTE